MSFLKRNCHIVQEDWCGEINSSEVDDLILGYELQVLAVHQANSSSKKANVPFLNLHLTYRSNSFFRKQSNCITFEVFQKIFHSRLSENRFHCYPIPMQIHRSVLKLLGKYFWDRFLRNWHGTSNFPLPICSPVVVFF